MTNLNRRLAVSGIAASLVSPSFAARPTWVPASFGSYAIQIQGNSMLYFSNREVTDLILRSMEEGFSQADDVLNRLPTTNGPAIYHNGIWRDIMQRSNLVVLLLDLVSKKKDKSQTYVEFATDAVLTLAHGIIVTYAQEVMQLFMRKRFGMPEEAAKWAASGIIFTEIGIWKKFIYPHIIKALMKAYYGERNELRKLLANEKPTTFQQFFTNNINNLDHLTAGRTNEGWGVMGWSQTYWGTPYNFGLDVTSRGYDECAKYSNRAQAMCSKS